MSVYRMNAVFIIGDASDIGDVTERIGRTGVFQPDDIGKFYSDTRLFTQIRDENPYTSMMSELLKIDPSASDDRSTSASSATDAEISEYISSVSEKAAAYTSERAALTSRLEHDLQSEKDLRHFTELDVPLEDIFSCRYVKARFGCLTKDSLTKFRSLYANDTNIVFLPCSEEADICFGTYFTPSSRIDEVDRIFSGLYFMPIDMSKYSGKPSEAADAFADDAKKVRALISEKDIVVSQIRKKEHELCASYYIACRERSDFFKMRKYAVLHKDNFLLCGWVPESDAEKLTSSVQGIENLEIRTENASHRGRVTPPVKLKNPSLFRPYEFYVKIYGLPSYGETDPTVFVSLTYTLMFGIMFGDVGQGLILALIGWLMWKIKRMQLGKILIPCGISASLFGLVYGSVFGFEHLLDPLYKAIGFAEKPVNVMSPATTQIIIYGAVGLGFLLVVIAMLLNIVSQFRRKKPGLALFSASGVCGFVFYVSLIIGVVCQMFLNIKVLTVPYIIFLLAIPLLCIFFGELLTGLVEKDASKKPDSWFDYLIQSFFEMFEVLLGYVTNTMSFLRVGAFVLVHAGMMMVVFTLAEMTSGIAYALIVIIGNAIVLCLEALLVGIQGLRLEFYEMFSRFFEGEGSPYEPVVSPYLSTEHSKT